jgi:hypothetical protein
MGKVLALLGLLALPLTADATIFRLHGETGLLDGLMSFDESSQTVSDWDIFFPSYHLRLYKAPCDFDPLIGGCTPPVHYAHFEPNHLTIGTFGSPAQTTTLELFGTLQHGGLLSGIFTIGGASGSTDSVLATVAPEADMMWFLAAGVAGLMWKSRRAWAKWH